MEEKKLTDEEIVTALECCIKGVTVSNCAECPLDMIEEDCCYYTPTLIDRYALDLIHRLQSENKQLKCDSYRTSWKAKFLEAKKEIERLTERETFLENAWKTSLESTQTVEIALKANRAREEELKKQVDELTKQREVGREKLKNEIANKIFMSASHGAIQCGKMSVAIAEIEAEKYVEFSWEIVQQAVKDTAKDILTKMLTNAKRLKEQFNSTTYGKNREHLIATIEIEIEGIKNLAKRYAVEVE